MKSFVSLLFIVLLIFFDYNMDMLKSREDFSCSKKKVFLQKNTNAKVDEGITGEFRSN
ncbi:hypothetical protein NSB25_00830 [Acetatifactor muris]|uniref:Uncharacterized protein n=1 Tax=Acetatifactor muris TaxID=879566 RepID=A0A2K4ZGI0_9FIRM|nr:hypothetical protein [Acetatifactor muris]MCI8800608.1 hypothetical protein [Lachnospiraceae bacterium]MCR2045832.1 hypothetical protein [Acetatifactor muris]SOY29571.1 hypothetical protein AMURIS_02292 [Acetatifactor muris]